MKGQNLQKAIEILVLVAVVAGIAHFIDNIFNGSHMADAIRSPYLILLIWLVSFLPGPIGVAFVRKSAASKKRFRIGLLLVFIFGSFCFFPMRHFASKPPFSKFRLPGGTEFNIWLLAILGICIIIASILYYRKGYHGYSDLVELQGTAGETPGMKYISKTDAQSLEDSGKLGQAKIVVETTDLSLDVPIVGRSWSNEKAAEETKANDTAQPDGTKVSIDVEKRQSDSRDVKNNINESTSVVGDIVVAQYEYNGLMKGELSFVEGDIIAILEIDARGWWRGRSERTGQEGLFPINFFHPF